MNSIILIIGYLVILSVLLRICYTDLKSRTIEHLPLGVLLVAILPVSYIQFEQIFWLQSILTLVIGFILFTLNVIGAGDVKFATVLMLGIPPDLVLPFWFYVSIAGGAIAFIGLIFFNKSVREDGLPYGIAITCGFIVQLAGFYKLL